MNPISIGLNLPSAACGLRGSMSVGRSVLALAVIIHATCSVAQAAIHRHAVLIGNNRGLPDETELLYAERDVRRIGDILSEVGRFDPQNLVLLTGENSGTVSRALISVNDRIRRQIGSSSDQALLLVYYSGHADAESLHLGHTSLGIEQIKEMVKESSATVRILILDSCRSGALTKVKGFRRSDAFPIRVTHGLSGEGVVFITSSAVNEDSQESDLLKGSFFTHHFASGLLGAADYSNDGRVSLSEVYRYAYRQTIASTSRTLTGVQHPTYHYELRGKDDLFLTEIAAASSRRSRLLLPAGGNYLLMRERDGGELVAEVQADGPRRVTLPPGRYFVRLRVTDHLREGTVELPPGKDVSLKTGDLDRVPYERMVRKGTGQRRLAHGPLALFAARSEVVSGLGWHPLGGVGYPLHFSWFSITPRLLIGTSSAENQYLQVRQREVEVEVFLSRSFDLPWLTVAVGINLGVSYLRETFDAEGSAPERNTLAFMTGVQGEIVRHLGFGFYIQAEVSGVVYVFLENNGTGTTEVVTPFVPRLGTGLGYCF
jgi:hypothetical protein